MFCNILDAKARVGDEGNAGDVSAQIGALAHYTVDGVNRPCEDWEDLFKWKMYFAKYEIASYSLCAF